MKCNSGQRVFTTSAAFLSQVVVNDVKAVLGHAIQARTFGWMGFCGVCILPPIIFTSIYGRN